MVMRLTTPPEAHSSLTTSTSTSSSQPFPFTFSPPNLSSGRPLHSPPSYRFPEECMNTFGARPMAEEWVPVVRRGLWKCDGSSHPGGSIAQGCGRILMEGAVQAHLANCTKVAELQAALSPPSLPVSKKNISALNGLAGSSISGAIGKKGHSGGLKRAGSEVSQVPSETATPKKIRLGTPSVTGMNDTNGSVIGSGNININGSSSLPAAGVPGTIDQEDGRMWLDNGRKETKKQMAKRMAQERRDKKSGVGGIAVGEEVGADGKKKKDKEFSWDRNCGVVSDWGQPCQRKLDCKIHLVNDKRAVQGRSMPYDECMKLFKLEQGGAGEVGPDGKAKLTTVDGDEDELALKPGTSITGSTSGIVGSKGKKRRLKGVDGAADALATSSTMQTLAGGLRAASAAHARELLENVELGNIEMQALLDVVRSRSSRVDNWSHLKALSMDPDELKTNHIKRKKQAQMIAEAQAAAAAASAAAEAAITETQGSTSSGKPSQKGIPDASTNGPPPSSSTKSNFDFLTSNSSAPSKNKSISSSEAAGGRAPGSPPTSPPATNGKRKPNATATATATSTTELPAPLPLVPGLNLPAKQPTSTMKYQTFAGGATSGVWHLSRRSFLATERAFGDIWAQISVAKKNATAAAAVLGEAGGMGPGGNSNEGDMKRG